MLKVWCMIVCLHVEWTTAFVNRGYGVSSSSSSSSSLILNEKRQVKVELMEEDSSAALLERRSELDVLNEETGSRREFLTSCTAYMLTTAAILGTQESAMAMETKDNTSTSTSTSTSSSSLLTSSSSSSSSDSQSILETSWKKAWGGGKAGASAAVVQVLSLMWLRTAMNYQYRFGGTLQTSLKSLYEEGGIPRLYQGLPFALIQGPLTRFGDTAANVGILVLLEPIELPLFLKTACASIAAGSWRILCMPIDTSKTILQVQGPSGFQSFVQQDLLQNRTIAPLYRGAVASAAATAVGHFPWFLSYNYFSELLPPVSNDVENALLLTLARSAAVGLIASCVSDCTSNSLRVLKTTKQTSTQNLSYKQTIEQILETDGWAGLLGRGLQTRLLTNAIQGATFSVLWKYFQMKS